MKQNQYFSQSKRLKEMVISSKYQTRHSNHSVQADIPSNKNKTSGSLETHAANEHVANEHAADEHAADEHAVNEHAANEHAVNEHAASSKGSERAHGKRDEVVEREKRRCATA